MPKLLTAEDFKLLSLDQQSEYLDGLERHGGGLTCFT